MVLDKSFKKYDELIDVAFEEFSKHSFAQVSLNSILTKSKISKGDFYYHFKNKDDLYLHLVGISLVKKKEFIQSHIHISSTSFFDILRLNIEMGLKFGQAHPVLANFSQQLIKSANTPMYKKVFETYNLNQDEYFHQLIDQAMKNRELRDDIPTEVVISLIKHVLTHATDMIQVDSIQDYESKIYYLMSFLESGLKPVL